jgi:hypothetical protein
MQREGEPRPPGEWETDLVASLVVLVLVLCASCGLAYYLWRRWQLMRHQRSILRGGIVDLGEDSDEDLVLGEEGAPWLAQGEKKGQQRGGDVGTDRSDISDSDGDRKRRKRIGKFAFVTEGSVVPAVPGIEAAAPAPQFDTFTSKLHHFSVARPRGWRVQAALTEETTVVQFVCPRSSKTYQRFSVSWDDVSWAATTSERFVRALASQITREMKGARVISVEPWGSSWCVKYVVAADSEAEGSAELQLLSVVVMAGRGRSREKRSQSWARAFTLSFVCDQPEFERLLPFAKCLIDSFTLEREALDMPARLWGGGMLMSHSTSADVMSASIEDGADSYLPSSQPIQASLPAAAATRSMVLLPRLTHRDFPSVLLSLLLPSGWRMSTSETATPRMDATFAPIKAGSWSGSSIRVVCVELTPMLAQGNTEESVYLQWLEHYESQIATDASLRVDSTHTVSPTATVFVLSSAGASAAELVARARVGVHLRSGRLFGHVVTVSGRHAIRGQLVELADAVYGSIDEQTMD